MVTINIVDAREGWLDVQNHPKDPSKGTKQVRISPKILIERDDAEVLVVGQNATFINWGNLMIEEIHTDQSGNIIDVKARLNLTDKNYKKTLKITWIAAPLDKYEDTQENKPQSNPISCYAVYFDHILNIPVLGKDDDFKNFVAKDTRVIYQRFIYLHKLCCKLYVIFHQLYHEIFISRKRLKCGVKQK